VVNPKNPKRGRWRRNQHSCIRSGLLALLSALSACLLQRIFHFLFEIGDRYILECSSKRLQSVEVFITLQAAKILDRNESGQWRPVLFDYGLSLTFHDLAEQCFELSSSVCRTDGSNGWFCTRQ
jgi:hypothetical protein